MYNYEPVFNTCRIVLSLIFIQVLTLWRISALLYGLSTPYFWHPSTIQDTFFAVQGRLFAAPVQAAALTVR